ncbi:uncharacterized protein A4U43_C04F7890 [Asparagus officinalis]|uniref:Branchpoint-bridging protein n=1 Tax=Asparagus officinalis TaxID=4686 RepID=A0A5P1EZR6_ASPOF|nr:uncharacterized protein LOC109838298 [Asparagus officinalis]ONK71374.1 uncharacterized protein A4U43_C04F7890 [Asparagus officinalis]
MERNLCLVVHGETRSNNGNRNVGIMDESEEEPSEEPHEEEPCEEEPYEEEPSEEEPYEQDPRDEEPYEQDPSEEEPSEEEPYEQDPSEEEPFEEEPYEEDPSEDKPNEEETYEDNPSQEEPFEEEACQTESDDEPYEKALAKDEPSEGQLACRSYNRDSDKDSAQSSSNNLLGKSRNLSSSLIISEKEETARISHKRKLSKWDAVPGDSGSTDDCVHVDIQKKNTISKMPGAIKLPDFLFDPEFQNLHKQASKITERLLDREVIDDRQKHERSPSPPPGFEILKESKLRQKLMMQRQTILSELVQNFPGFKPPPYYIRPKLQKKIYIPEKEYPGYNFIGLIIGPQGITQKRMQKETGANITIRGKGFMRKDKLSNPDPSDNEDTHVFIEAESQASLDAAANMVEKLLIPVQEEYNVHKLTQLRELAEKNQIVTGNNSIHQQSNFSQAYQPTSINNPISNSMELQKQIDYSNPYAAYLPQSAMANPVTHSMKPQKQIDYSNLYVAHLPQSVDECKLSQLFLPFGEICSSIIRRDKITGISKGYGFVKYKDPANAAMAISYMNGYQIDGHALAVRVAGIPPSVTNSSMGFQSIFQLPNFIYPAPTVQYDAGSMYWPNNSVATNIDPFSGYFSASLNSTGHYLLASSMIYGYPASNETAQFSSSAMTFGSQPQLYHQSMPLNSQSFSHAHPVQISGSFDMPPPSDLTKDSTKDHQASSI